MSLQKGEVGTADKVVQGLRDLYGNEWLVRYFEQKVGSPAFAAGIRDICLDEQYTPAQANDMSEQIVGRLKRALDQQTGSSTSS